MHNRSAQSDCVLALALAAMQKSSKLRLALMSATGDHKLVEERNPYSGRILFNNLPFMFEPVFFNPQSSRTKLGNQTSFKNVEGQFLHAFC